MNQAVPPRAGVAAPLIILVSIAVGSVLLSMSMLRYPGGTAMDPSTVGHSFWLNFLCDITSGVAVNGRANQAGALLARLALLFFCLALTLFWVILPRSFGSRCGRTESLVIRVLGLLSVVGLLVVPVAGGWLHVVAVFASSLPALVAGVLALLGTVKYSRTVPLVLIAGATVLTSAVDSVLYAGSYMSQPRVVHPALPAFQRLALILMLIWMGTVAARAVRIARSEPGGAAATPPRP